MSQYSINLTAGKKTPVEVRGQFFMLRSVTNSATIDVLIEVRGGGDSNDESFDAVQGGFKARINGNRFDRVLMTASADCVVKYVISDNAVDFDFFAGASVNATLVSPIPLPVSNDRGTPGNLMFVSGVSIADAPATAIIDDTHVACSSVIAALYAANANRREARITNFGPDPVAIVAPGGTWAKRSIVLQVGDSHYETRAANLAMSAICDVGKTADVGIQEITA